jgi:hypothetical protein
MTDANRQIERLSKLGQEGRDDDLRNTTVEERWNMIWPLTVSAWAMKGINVAEQEFQRHVECLKRLGE